MKRWGIIGAIFFVGLVWQWLSPGQDQAAEGFKPALPGRAFVFPEDHRVHRDYKTEWWYYNGQLQDAEGRRYGYQLTFFRVGIRPGPVSSQGSRWRVREVYLAHLAVTDVDRKRFSYAEKISRGNLGLAGAETGRYRVWIEDWSVGEEGKAQVLRAGDRSLGLVPSDFSWESTRDPWDGRDQPERGWNRAGFPLLFPNPNGHSGADHPQREIG